MTVGSNEARTLRLEDIDLSTPAAFARSASSCPTRSPTPAPDASRYTASGSPTIWPTVMRGLSDE